MKIKRISAYILDSLILLMLVSFLITPIQLNDKKVFTEFKEHSKEILDVTADYIKVVSSNDVKKSLELEKKVKSLGENSKKLQYKHRYSLYFLSQKILTVLLTIVYFVIFPLFNNGQTLFKKIFKIKVEYDTILKYLLREEMARNFVLTSLILYFIASFNYSLFSLYLGYITPITLSFMIINFIVFLVNKDNKALHDIIAGTNVVEV
ncbi:MAG: RDD family protein [Clostridiales bacterium]|nr:RDD family protein [Clostridiales bacterium]